MSDVFASTSSERSNLHDAPESAALQLGEPGAGNGLEAGEDEVQVPIQERSSPATAELPGGVRATRTEEYFHHHLQLVHFERVLSLLGREDINDAERTEVLACGNRLVDEVSDLTSISGEYAAKCTTTFARWAETTAQIANGLSHRGVWAWLSHWYLVVVAQYRWIQHLKAQTRLRDKLLDVAERQNTVLRKMRTTEEVMATVQERLVDEVLQLIILSNGP